MTEGRSRLLWPIFFLVAAVFVFPAFLPGGGQFFLRDFHPFFQPQKLFLAKTLAGGSLPTWMPHTSCGVPFMASLQPGVFYPPSLLLLVGQAGFGLKLLVWFHLLLAFFGAAALARSLWKAGPWACCITGSGFAFGGFLVSTLSQFNHFQAAAWAPLTMLAMTGLRDRRSSGRLVLVALAVAMQALAGGVEILLLTLGLGFVMTLALPGSARQSRRRAASVLAGASLGLLLVAFQLAPTQEMAGRSIRAGEGPAADTAGVYALERENLANLAAPRRLVDVGESGYFRAFPGGRVPWLISIYLGAVVLYLALRGLLLGGASPVQRLTLAVAALVGVLLAMGDGFPGFGWFRYPEKMVFLPALSVPLLAGLADTVGGRPASDGRGRWWLEAAALLVPLGLLTVPIFAGERLGAYTPVLPAILLLLAALVVTLHRRQLLGRGLTLALLATLAVADLSSAHRRLNATVPDDFYSEPPAAARLILDQPRTGPHPPRLRVTLPGLPGGRPVTERGMATPLETHLLWRAYLSPNCAGIHGISQIRGSTGMELARPAQRERLLALAPVGDKLALLALWGTEFLLMDRELDAPADVQPVAGVLEPRGQRLYRLTRPLPRVFLADGTLVEQYPLIEQRMLAGETGLTGLVEELRRRVLDGASAGERAQFDTWSAGRMEVDVHTGRDGRVLVVTESHDPGWRALVNGREVPVREGLGGFLLVDLPSAAGRHRVALQYRPPRFVPGLALSGLALVALLAVWIAERRKAITGLPGPVDSSGAKP